MIDYLLMILMGYLMGSMPTGLVIGWIFRRIDVRTYGSGKTGMTNVLRTAGLPAAALVLFLDMGKAIMAVVIARIVTDSPGVEAASGIFILIGHIWSVFIKFGGGRGTAPGWGALIILSPVAGLVATVSGLFLVWTTRYVSVGSMVGCSLGCITLIILAILGDVPLEYIFYGVVGGSLVVSKHIDNIKRLRKGTERKLGRPADPI